jgi:L-alanine-DL-glutamate epimerase-like enolase superfamily enzyme
MKIERIYSRPIRIPLKRFFYNSEGAGTKREWGGRLSRVTPKRPNPILEYVLVRIETDADLVGIGEAPADIGFFGQTLEGIQYAIDDYLGPQLVGREPLDIDALMARIDYRENCCAKSGIAMALHDLVAKSEGISVASCWAGESWSGFLWRSRLPAVHQMTWPTNASNT